MLSQVFMYDQPLTTAYIENVKGGKCKYTQLYEPLPCLLFSIFSTMDNNRLNKYHFIHVPTNSKKESLKKYLRQMYN